VSWSFPSDDVSAPEGSALGVKHSAAPAAFQRYHRTEKTTTPLWNNDRYLANVSLNPIGRYDRDYPASCPECVGHFTVIYPSETFSRSAAFYPKGTSFGRRGIDDGKMPSRERPGKKQRIAARCLYERSASALSASPSVVTPIDVNPLIGFFGTLAAGAIA